MPWKIQIEESSNCVATTYLESFDLLDIPKVYVDIFKLPSYQDGLNFLFDFSQITLDTPSSYKAISAEAASLYQEINLQLPAVKVALVAGNSGNFKLLHQWTTAGRMSPGKVERRLFKDLVGANNWMEASD